MSRLFGTDGIRGEAGVAPLDRPTLCRVGRALARNLNAGGPPRILIGRDTRSSGAMIETWLRTGIHHGGGQTVSVGVITTPAIAFLTRRCGFSAGVVISASHNPCPDNGVKIFTGDGAKSDDVLETAIEAEVAEWEGEADERDLPPSPPRQELRDHYIEALEETLPPSLKLPPFRIVLDCANGAAHEVGPAVLSRLGLDLFVTGASPDGRNINQKCGSTHPEVMARHVIESKCDLGASLDGDGDRLVLADHTGRIVDGDGILLLCARRWNREGRLPGAAIVATVMSNLALEQALKEEGLGLFRTQVGDKYVAEEMERRGLTLGGEQSGHIIFSEYASTGDGLLTLLQVLRVLAVEGRSLAELSHLKPFPQVLVNVRVRSKPAISDVPEIRRAVDAAERRLGGRGRILVRYSGTEPLLRIMMEGPEEEEIRDLSNWIGDTVQRTIGGS